MSVDPKHTTTLQGKTYVMYGGLIHEAHERKVKSITTEIVKLQMDGPTPTFALVKARVEMEDGRVFEGYGDANASNVNKGVGKHLIRTSETRAKARALRDAVDVGEVAFDELGGDDQQPASDARRSSGSRERSSRGQTTTSSGESDSRASVNGEPAGGSAEDRITTEQRKRITELAQDFYPDGLRELQMKVLKKQQITKLTRTKADKLIARLEEEIKKRDDALGGSSDTGDDDVDFDEEDLDEIDNLSRGVPASSGASRG